MLYDCLCKLWDIIKCTLLVLALLGLVKLCFIAMQEPHKSDKAHVLTYEEVRASVPADDWQDFLDNGGWYALDLPREADLNR